MNEFQELLVYGILGGFFVGAGLMLFFWTVAAMSRTRYKPMRRKSDVEEIPEAEAVDETEWGDAWKRGIRPDGSRTEEED